MNAFLRAYTKTDVSRGTFELYSEVEAEGGGYRGYVRPFFRELDFRNVEDPNESLAVRAKEKVVGALSRWLKNDEERKVATEVPFSGDFGNGRVGLWESVHNLMRNAFVEALKEGFKTQQG